MGFAFGLSYWYSRPQKFVIVSQLSYCAEVLIRSFRNVGSKYPVSGKAKAVDPKWKKFLSLMIINCWQEAPFVKSICNGPEIIHWKFLLCPPVLNMSDTCRHSRIWTKNWPKVLKDNISWRARPPPPSTFYLTLFLFWLIFPTGHLQI